MRPVRLHPDCPTRLHWRGRAAFLLGSTEHYGALLNAAFDYERYLDTLAADGLTLTRMFALFRQAEGVIDERIGDAGTLTPLPACYLAPWARSRDSNDPGPDGLPKFDLEQWDERYFSRLQGILTAAEARGVVVELVFFCSPYDDARWRRFPLHPASNVNGVGTGMAEPGDFLSLADPSVTHHQRRLVRKLVAETNRFGNLYYEICNEPGKSRDGDPQPEVVRDWQRVLIDTVRETERALPERHLVAVNPHMLLHVREPDNPADRRIGILDDGYYRDDPEVDLLNIHYISHRPPREGLHHAYPGGARPQSPAYRFGNITTFLTLREASGKPIGFDEDYAGIVNGQPAPPAPKRMEAWESLLSGCATYDHLDFTFTKDDPTGAGRGRIPVGLTRELFDGRTLRRQLSHVAACAETVDLSTLRADPLAVQRTPRNVGAVVARSTSPDGGTVLVYLADLRRTNEGLGGTLGGTLCLGRVPAGVRYGIQGLDPQTGEWTSLPDVATSARGELRVDLPAFREDLLLRLVRSG